MIEYKIHPNGYIIRQSDGAWIPLVVGNSDYQEYLIWTSAGNVAPPVDPPPSPDVTP